jgi:hypothetical protein
MRGKPHEEKEENLHARKTSRELEDNLQNNGRKTSGLKKGQPYG